MLKNWIGIFQNMFQLTSLKNRPKYKTMQFTHLPDPTSQTETVWSKEPVIILSPVVLNDKEIISAEWPWKKEINFSEKVNMNIRS